MHWAVVALLLYKILAHPDPAPGTTLCMLHKLLFPPCLISISISANPFLSSCSPWSRMAFCSSQHAQYTIDTRVPLPCFLCIRLTKGKACKLSLQNNAGNPPPTANRSVQGQHCSSPQDSRRPLENSLSSGSGDVPSARESCNLCFESQTQSGAIVLAYHGSSSQAFALLQARSLS